MYIVSESPDDKPSVEVFELYVYVVSESPEDKPSVEVFELYVYIVSESPDDKPSVEVFELKESSSESVSPDMETHALFVKLKEVNDLIIKCSCYSGVISHLVNLFMTECRAVMVYICIHSYII